MSTLSILDKVGNEYTRGGLAIAGIEQKIVKKRFQEVWLWHIVRRVVSNGEGCKGNTKKHVRKAGLMDIKTLGLGERKVEIE